MGQKVTQWCRGEGAASVGIGAVAALLIVAVWLLTLQRIGFEREQTLNEAVSHNNNLALTLEEHALRTIESADQLLLALRRSYRERGASGDIGQLMASGSFDTTLFNAAGIADARGEVLGSLRGSTLNVADREYFSAHLRDAQRGLVIAKPVVARVTGLPTLFLSRALNEPGEPFSGVAMVGIPARFFQNIYDQVDVGRHGVVALVGTDGVVRAAPGASGLRTGQDVKDSLLFAQLRSATTGSFAGSGKLDGIARLLSYRAVQGQPLVVVVGTSRDEVLAAFADRARFYRLGAIVRTLMILLIAIVIWGAFQRQRRAHERVRRLSARLLEIQESERRMLARELHDDVGQELTGMRLLLSSVAASVPAGLAGQDLAHCQQAVDTAIAKVRNLSLDLRPSQLDELGLVAALRWHIDRVQRTATARITFVQELGSTRLPPDIEIAAFRIAQEALNNAVKHSRAGNIAIAVHLHRALELCVRDDGVGFLPAEARRSAAARGSMGLMSMEERARLVGGTFELVAAEGQGCSIRCALPLEPAPQLDQLQPLAEVS